MTCIHCKTVSVAVTREYAEKEVADFNRYYDSLPPSDKKFFHGHSSIDRYRCCGNMKLRDFIEGDAPDGITMSAVILE